MKILLEIELTSIARDPFFKEIELPFLPPINSNYYDEEYQRLFNVTSVSFTATEYIVSVIETGKSDGKYFENAHV